MSWKRRHDQVHLVNKIWKRPKQDFGKGPKRGFGKDPLGFWKKKQMGKCTLDGFGKGHHVYRSG